MPRVTQSHLVVPAFAAALIVVFSCTPKKPPETTEDDSCITEHDCPNADFFLCDKATSKCVPSCRNTSGCAASMRGEFALAECSGTLGCVCDQSVCTPRLCSSDSDCGSPGSLGSLVCRNATCVSPPAAASIASCRITPDYVTLPQDGEAKFYVSTWDAQQNPVVVSGAATWASTQPATATAQGTGNQATLQVAVGASAGESKGLVQAKVDGGRVTCTATVNIVDKNVPVNSVRVMVSDEITGRPISDAKVLVTKEGSAATALKATTNASGVATTAADAALANGSLSVHVFHNDYNYLTIAGYQTTGRPILSVVLRRNPLDKHGGYKGTFAEAPRTVNVQAALTGLSLSGALTDLSFQQLLGGTVESKLPAELARLAQNREKIPVPAGVYLAFNGSSIKDVVSARGAAGVCTKLPDAAARTLNGGCGTGTAWGLTGDVPLSKLTAAFGAFAGADFASADLGKLIPELTKTFHLFQSTVTRDVEYQMEPLPGIDTGNQTVREDAFYTKLNPSWKGVPLGFAFVLDPPELPKFQDKHMDGLFLLGGAVVGGSNVVPLGLGAAVNKDGDRNTDAMALEDAAGAPISYPADRVPMRMAPAHHGLEGAEYGLVALATSFAGQRDPMVGFVSSAIFHRFNDNKLVFEPDPARAISLGGEFLKLPEHAGYNYLTRTFRFTQAPDTTNVDVVRVVFSDQSDRRWVVYMNPAAAAGGSFTLPTPGTHFPGMKDRTDSGDAFGQRSEMLVQMLRLSNNPRGTDTLGFKELVEANKWNGDRLMDFTQAFSVVDYARPEIEWRAPGLEAATVAPGGIAKVKVARFRVGDHGVVKFRFFNKDRTSACGQATVSAHETNGKPGYVAVQVPAACPSEWKAEAQLYETSGTAGILPVVRTDQTSPKS